MPTLNQLIRKPRKLSSSKTLNALRGAPMRFGICVKVYTLAPKKPNSSIRKVARVRLSNSLSLIGYIPGEGHSLQAHARVAVRGGRVKDLPAVKFHLIRGLLDLKPVVNRRNARSKYGAKKPIS